MLFQGLWRYSFPYLPIGPRHFPWMELTRQVVGFLRSFLLLWRSYLLPSFDLLPLTCLFLARLESLPLVLRLRCCRLPLPQFGPLPLVRWLEFQPGSSIADPLRPPLPLSGPLLFECWSELHPDTSIANPHCPGFFTCLGPSLLGPQHLLLSMLVLIPADPPLLSPPPQSYFLSTTVSFAVASFAISSKGFF